LICSNIIIITGFSGSGKSTAIAALEDAGYYCVDNMPVALLPDFLKLPIESGADFAGCAFVMDLREHGFLSKYAGVMESLKKTGCSIEIVFLEADEKTLLQRYKQTRRHHPLAAGKSLIEGIRAEKKLLQDLRKSAERVIDTSTFNVHELKSMVLHIAQNCTSLTPMAIQVMSFGYKYGIPLDADLIIDVRFLSNPYFVPKLKQLDGESKKIQDFVLKDPETALFLRKYLDLLDYLIPLYEKEGKAYLTIAIGCTGGRHRSVVIARAVGEHLLALQKQITITHRDIGQSQSLP
jgi:RNase adapter protein RapZ